MNPNQTFEGKVAIVTGAGSGIGFDIAKELINQGASVIINDINTELINAAHQRLGAVRSCVPIAGDAGNLAHIDDMINLAVDRFGRLDISIANAGMTSYGAFLKTTEKQFDQLIDLNLKGSYFLAQKSALQMIKQESDGRILLMSSVTGVLSHPFLAAYGMTKAAIGNLAKNLVLEIARYGITINAIAPGAVATERTMSMDVNYDRTWGQLIPTGRASSPGDISRLALFLVSPQSGQINGQTIVVDGGITTLCAVPPDTDEPNG
ncbi:MAG: SDR family oxidoreductase [Saprospiraceae bacterium]|nr:SDR family oxidoreductase [Saprospiraceae bacterium]